MSNSKAIVMHPEAPLTEWGVMRSQAEELLQSGFLPKSIRTAEQAIAIMQTGKELGLGPMQSLRGIHVIDGKPAMSADLIAGLALARVPGSTLRVVESTNTICRVEAGRAGQALTPFSFSFDDARNAGLTGKDVWRKYPRAMLRARCLTEACRAIFPDVVMGLYSPEELEDSAPGQVIDVQPFRDQGPQLVAINPHTAPGEDPAAEEDVDLVTDLSTILENLKADIAAADSYDRVLELQAILGSKRQQTELLKRLQAGRESGAINATSAASLGKLWQHCFRQLQSAEKALATGPEDALVGDGKEEVSDG